MPKTSEDHRLNAALGGQPCYEDIDDRRFAEWHRVRQPSPEEQSRVVRALTPKEDE